MAYMIVSKHNPDNALCANWFSIGWAPWASVQLFLNKEDAEKVCEAVNLMADKSNTATLRAAVAEVRLGENVIKPDICGDCQTCVRKLCTGAKTLSQKKQKQQQEGSEGMGNTVTLKLNARNTERLLKVAKALECEPEILLNDFLMSGLEDPCAVADCMDYTEGGKVNAKDAKKAAKRVMAAATMLASEGWVSGGKE